MKPSSGPEERTVTSEIQHTLVGHVSCPPLQIGVGIGTEATLDPWKIIKDIN